MGYYAPRGGPGAQGRILTFTLSLLSLTVHALFAIFLHYLPPDPLGLILSFSLYSAFAALTDSMGLVGAIRRSAALVTIFTHQLLIDVIISSVPRLLLICFVISSPITLCADVEYQRAELSRRGATELAPFWTPARCLTSLKAVQMLSAGIIVGITVIQCWCALKVRSYAWYLAEEERARKNFAEHLGSVGESQDQKQLARSMTKIKSVYELE